MKTKSFLPLVLLLGVTGCAGPGRFFADLAGAGAGGALAHRLSNGDAAWTAGGAVGGLALAEGARALANRAEQKAYQRGLDQGRSDAVRDTYWQQQNAHRPTPAAARATLYPIRLPEQEVDGSFINPPPVT